MEDEGKGIGLLRNKKFWIRTASGFVMSCMLVVIFVLGGDVMLCFLGALSLIGLFELYRALDLKWSVLSIIGYLSVIAHYVSLRFIESKYIILIYACSLIAMLVVFVVSFPKFSLQQIFGAYVGIFYVGVTLSFLYLLRIHPPSGAYLVWLIVFASWGSDIFAYFAGMKLGKHPFAHKISPKKSLEGAIGGVAGAILLSVIYGFIVQKYIPDIKLAPLVFGITCGLGACVSQVGDLAASAIKRHVGIKDYGKIIPGHGGVLDRFDSMIIVAPVMYLVAVYSIMF